MFGTEVQSGLQSLQEKLQENAQMALEKLHLHVSNYLRSVVQDQLQVC